MSNQRSIEEWNRLILPLIPQQPPFRYLDEIIEIDDNYVTGSYRFKTDEWFYRGHFPNNPVTPGVILVETMAQTALGAACIFSLTNQNYSPEEIAKFLPLLTDVDGEFLKPVTPGDKVVIKGEKVYWRRNKFRSKASLYLENGEIAASAVISGLQAEAPLG